MIVFVNKINLRALQQQKIALKTVFSTYLKQYIWEDYKKLHIVYYNLSLK